MSSRNSCLAGHPRRTPKQSWRVGWSLGGAARKRNTLGICSFLPSSLALAIMPFLDLILSSRFSSFTLRRSLFVTSLLLLLSLLDLIYFISTVRVSSFHYSPTEWSSLTRPTLHFTMASPRMRRLLAFPFLFFGLYFVSLGSWAYRGKPVSLLVVYVALGLSSFPVSVESQCKLSLTFDNDFITTFSTTVYLATIHGTASRSRTR